MKVIVAMLLATAVTAPCLAQSTVGRPAGPAAAESDIRAISPALDRYSREVIMGDLWQRPQLSPRDRSVVTLAVLISRQDVAELPAQFRRALDNGVTPAEISEIITHLTFYSGLGDATAAAGPAREVFAERGIGPGQLPPASPQLLPIDQAAEAWRAATVHSNVGPIYRASPRRASEPTDDGSVARPVLRASLPIVTIISVGIPPMETPISRWAASRTRRWLSSSPAT